MQSTANSHHLSTLLECLFPPLYTGMSISIDRNTISLSIYPHTLYGPPPIYPHTLYGPPPICPHTL